MILVGKTQRGKNRIQEHGNIFHVVMRVERTPCLDYRPGLLVHAEDGYKTWIAEENDRDFEIQKEE